MVRSGNAKSVVVVGSLNMDLVMRLPRMPAGGETLFGHEFLTVPGGKGANQAIACARLGGRVSMLGQVGDDAFGRVLVDSLVADGVDVTGIGRNSANSTGVAIILLEDNGQNRIVLAAGANGELSAADVDCFRPAIEVAAMLVLQLEVPLAAVQRAVEIANAAGVMVLLNPAPALPLPLSLWSAVDIFVPNESEASILADQKVCDPESAYVAARIFRQRGVRSVLITLGGKGVVAVDDDGERHFPAQSVDVVDTTAAGDTFIGGLVVGLCEGMGIDDATAFGQRASGLCISRHGAQPSIPYSRELV